MSLLKPGVGCSCLTTGLRGDDSRSLSHAGIPGGGRAVLYSMSKSGPGFTAAWRVFKTVGRSIMPRKSRRKRIWGAKTNKKR